MFSKTAAKLAIMSAILVAPIAQAHAYSIHVKAGVYTIQCDNGVTSVGSTLQVSHAQAAYFCKVRGSSISSGGGGNPSDGASTGASAKAKLAR